MPKIVAQFKCSDCGDFEATSEEYSECKCGKNCVKPSEYSTSYMTDKGRGMNFSRVSNKTYRYKDEYIELSDDFYQLWNKLKEIKEERKYKSPQIYIYERTDKSDDGNEFMSSLKIEVCDVSKYNESNALKFSVDLNRTNQNSHKIYERLQRFYDLLLTIISNEINLNDRDLMQDITDDWHRRQHEVYDYEFYV